MILIKSRIYSQKQAHMLRVSLSCRHTKVYLNVCKTDRVVAISMLAKISRLLQSFYFGFTPKI